MNQVIKEKTTPAKEVVESNDNNSLAIQNQGVKKLTPEMIEALKKPLPAEAVSAHPTKTYLSSIKAIYVVERLNEVFGIGNWFQKNEVIQSPGKMKVVHSFLTIPEYGIELDNFGGNDNADEGDAWKGAATDALTKMASYLYIGMDVYKGLAKTTDNPNPAPSKPSSYKPSARQLEVIDSMMEQKRLTKENLIDLGFNYDKLTGGMQGTASELFTFLKTYIPTTSVTVGHDQMTEEGKDMVLELEAVEKLEDFKRLQTKLSSMKNQRKFTRDDLQALTKAFIKAETRIMA